MKVFKSTEEFVIIMAILLVMVFLLMAGLTFVIEWLLQLVS